LESHVKNTKCVKLNIKFLIFQAINLRIEGVGHNVGGHQEIHSEEDDEP
jgi:hypothetical protein